VSPKKSQPVTFLCNNCGDSFAKWFGKCPSCNEWNSLVEFRVPKPLPSASRRGGRSASPQGGLGIPGRSRREGRERMPGGLGGPGGAGWFEGDRDPGFDAGVTLISDISGQGPERILSGLPEFDRVLGGGIVPGSVCLVGGDPGVGKSTILLQVASRLTERGYGVLYVSGEESASQTRLRAQRLGVTGELSVMAEADLERIMEASAEGVHRVAEPAAERACDPATELGFGDGRGPVEVLVVDSIQSTYLSDLPSAPGSVMQVREGALALTRLAKQKRMAVLMIGHMTKDGNLAGPRTLEHIVDAVLTMEGDKFAAHRILRSVKNRFGSVHEIGVFDMREDGLHEVINPSKLFLGEDAGSTSGSVVSAGIEGTRSLLMEVQALVHPTRYGIPQRVATGFDARRMAILLAVLNKRGGEDVTASDVFVNVTGGLRVDEPGVDLGVLLAVASSAREVPVGGDLAVFGEVGLGGEVRRASNPEQRISEMIRLGYKRIVFPVATKRDLDERKWRPGGDDCTLIPVATLHEALSRVLGGRKHKEISSDTFR
jgi:DNA repair protein RadA/Sms